MRVLMLTHRVPYPANRGDRIRSYHLLQFLAQRCSVSLACTADEPVATETQRHLRSICEQLEICSTSRVGRLVRVAASLASGGSATEGHFWSRKLAATLRNWCHVQRFDAVVCYCSGMFRYVCQQEFSGIPLVVDLVDVDSRKWLDCAARARGPARWLYRLESERVLRIERELVDRSEAVTLISDAEARLFRELFPHASVHTVPNGVSSTSSEMPTKENVLHCVFVGALDYFPNIDGVSWFCREVWPGVRSRLPEARFQIVGRHPTTAIRRLATCPGLEVIGEVPEVQPYLRQAQVAVVPLRIARGVQNKVLEAMAAATPVIASSTSLQGLNLVVGEHVLRADTPMEWIDQICGLLQDRDQRSRLGAAGREFVLEHHRWQKCLQPFESILGIARTDRPTRPHEPASRRSSVATASSD